MKKRLCALLLGALMVLSLALPVRAVGLPFTDVPQSQWYYSDVVRAYETGLVNGLTDTTFGPDQNMTYAQAVKLAACMRQYALEGAVSLENAASGQWYQSYVDYAKQTKIISRDYSWNDNATRAGYAEIFASALPELAAKNTVADNAVPDVRIGDPQAAAIYTLYRAGIVEGSTKGGVDHCFCPNDPIKRSEVSAILTRMMDEGARKTFSMDKAYDGPAPADTSSSSQSSASTPTSTSSQPAGPVSLKLKYDGGGANDKYYVEEADLGAPACVDLDKDGKLDMLFGSGASIFCLDPSTGNTKWRFPAGSDRSAPKKNPQAGRLVADIQVLDVDGDGRNEFVTVNTNFGKGVSTIAVYNDQGYFEPGWPQTTNFPVFGLEVNNLEGDNWYEIMIGLGVGQSQAPSLYIFEPDGSQRPGWPIVSGYGFFANTLGAADLNGDGKKEVVALYDAEHTRAWDMAGNPVTATGGEYAGLLWNNMPVCEDYNHELACVKWAQSHGGTVAANGDGILGSSRSESYCIVGTFGGVVPADVDGNGTEELVYTALMVDGNMLMRNGGNTYEGVGKYYTPFILNKDRTRFNSGGYDWTQMPTDPAPIVSFDNTVIPNADMKPVVADLNGDGKKEILYAANDGQLHCWSLDKTQKGAWPVTFSTPSSTVKEFAARPVVADVNGDGRPEVITATYTQVNQTAKRGALYVLDSEGNVLSSATIPVTYAHKSDPQKANGCQATPCVADVDGDGKMEIALTTLSSGIVVYDVN